MHKSEGSWYFSDGRLTDGSHGFPEFGSLLDVFGSFDAERWPSLIQVKVTLIARDSHYLASKAGRIHINGSSCKWNISRAEIENVLPRQRLWTKPFSLCGVHDLVIVIWPTGEAGPYRDPRNNCSIYLVVPRSGSFTFKIRGGNQERELRHEFDGAPGEGWGWCRGFQAFCRLTDLLKPDGLQLEVQLVSKPPEGCCTIA